MLGCRDLDHEAEQEQEIILTLTDGKLGQENYITQAGKHVHGRYTKLKCVLLKVCTP